MCFERPESMNKNWFEGGKSIIRSFNGSRTHGIGRRRVRDFRSRNCCRLKPSLKKERRCCIVWAAYTTRKNVQTGKLRSSPCPKAGCVLARSSYLLVVIASREFFRPMGGETRRCRIMSGVSSISGCAVLFAGQRKTEERICTRNCRIPRVTTEAWHAYCFASSTYGLCLWARCSGFPRGPHASRTSMRPFWWRRP